MTRFSATAFLDDRFPDADEMCRILTTAGAPVPSKAAVVKWRLRNSIPGDSLAHLLFAMELDTGRPPSLAPFMEEEPDCLTPHSKDRSKPTGALLETFG